MLLKFVSVPAISALLMASSILAELTSKAQAASSQPGQTSCSLGQEPRLASPEIQSLLHQNAALLIASSSSTLPDEFAINFSEAESDAAVVLFGCDCPACLNVLRQLRRPSLSQKGEGHCMTNLAKRVSAEKVTEVLKALDAEEARNKP